MSDKEFMSRSTESETFSFSPKSFFLSVQCCNSTDEKLPIYCQNMFFGAVYERDTGFKSIEDNRLLKGCDFLSGITLSRGVIEVNVLVCVCACVCACVCVCVFLTFSLHGKTSNTRTRTFLKSPFGS